MKHQVSEADYVVAGAGTAGCLVAARLAQAGQSVILLEAGGPYRRVLDIPAVGLWAWLRWPRGFVWDSETVPQAGLGGRSVAFPTGRLTGGSSAVNAMIWCRGSSASYDLWGVPGWSYRDLEPWLREAESTVGVSESRFRTPLAEAFVRGAAEEAGVVRVSSFDSAACEGVGFYRVSQRAGRRSCTGTACLPDAGVRVVNGAAANRVLFRGGRATGIEYEAGGSTWTARARREVLVCTGTVRSPALLLRSGIGPAEELKRLGIETVADSASVGVGLRDQVRVPLVFAATHDYASPVRLIKAVFEYAASGSGLLSSNVVEAAALIRSSEHAAFPDAKVVFGWRVKPESAGSFVSLEVGVLAPKSSGRVWLGDASAEPSIDPGYLSDAADMRVLTHAAGLARRIAGSKAMREAGVTGEARPGAGSDWTAWVRGNAATGFHPVGTCRMGSDSGSVVDTELRVRGAEGLRVIDASVIPSPVSGNGQASVMAVAGRAASLVLGRG